VRWPVHTDTTEGHLRQPDQNRDTVTTYDLTRQITGGMPGYPDDPPVELREYADVEGDGYRATELRLTTHAGTHVDAPAHTEPHGKPIDAYPVEQFQFDALRLAVTVDAPREPIGREDIQDAASDADPGDAFAADMLVLDTGWADHWGDDWYDDHPYLTPEAAEWIADNGYHVGLDALSVDPTPTANARPDEPEGLPAHHALLGEGLFVVENLTNLEAPPRQFRLKAYPLPVDDADAAPARVVARA
jgi:kynurenine formamidase